MTTTGKAAISLSTGLDDAEKVTVAMLMALGAAESGRPTMMFLSKEAVRMVLPGIATAVACNGCPPLADLLARYEQAGGQYLVCPICYNAKQLPADALPTNAALGGTVPFWEWIGEGATTFSF